MITRLWLAAGRGRGDREPHRSERRRQDDDHPCRKGIAVLPEGARVFPEMSVLDNLKMGALADRARGRERQTLGEVYAMFPRLGERQTRTFASRTSEPEHP